MEMGRKYVKFGRYGLEEKDKERIVVHFTNERGYGDSVKVRKNNVFIIPPNTNGFAKEYVKDAEKITGNYPEELKRILEDRYAKLVILSYPQGVAGHHYTLNPIVFLFIKDEDTWEELKKAGWNWIY